MPPEIVDWKTVKASPSLVRVAPSRLSCPLIVAPIMDTPPVAVRLLRKILAPEVKLPAARTALPDVGCESAEPIMERPASRVARLKETVPSIVVLPRSQAPVMCAPTAFMAHSPGLRKWAPAARSEPSVASPKETVPSIVVLRRKQSPVMCAPSASMAHSPGLRKWAPSARSEPSVASPKKTRPRAVKC